jgi:RNA polymerase sigma-70 factor, ECF subfamily
MTRLALARESEPGALSGSATSGDPGEDGALLARLAVADAAAFATVVERHLPSLLAVARRMLRDDSEAEDMAQEALIRLWRNAGRLDVGAGGLRPWLRRVVSNLCIDRVRSARHLSVVEEVPEQPEPATQLRAIGDRERAERVDLALKRLPDRQRMALTLFHYEGLSQIEVGEILGVSDEAVESLLSRARRTMKTLLKDEWQQLLPDEEGQA